MRYLALGALWGVLAMAAPGCASTRREAVENSICQSLEYKLANSLWKARCSSNITANMVGPCVQAKSRLSEVYEGLHGYGQRLAACSAAKKSCSWAHKDYLQNREHYTKLLTDIQEALDP